MKEKYYVGLDIATSTGIAIWKPYLQAAEVTMVRQDPVGQMTRIFELTLPDKPYDMEPVYCLEEPHYFRNAKTARSLVERYGYIKNMILSAGYKVIEVNLNTSRKWLGVKDKQGNFMHYLPYYKGAMFSSDMADALTCALYVSCLDGQEVNWNAQNGLMIFDKETTYAKPR